MREMLAPTAAIAGMGLDKDVALITDGWFAGMWRVDQTDSLSEDEVASVRKDLSDSQFRQEYLCDFAASSDDVLIPIDLAEEASRRVLLPEHLVGVEKSLGVDVARFGADETAICPREGLLCHEIKTFRGLNTNQCVDRVIDVIDEFDPDMTFVDVGYNPGVFDGLIARGYKATSVDFGGKATREDRYYNKRAEMWGGVRDWLNRGGVIPRNDAMLRTDLSLPMYWYVGDSHRLQLESKDRIKERVE